MVRSSARVAVLVVAGILCASVAAAIGYSLIVGDEGVTFVVVLALGPVFEGAGISGNRTNAAAQ